MKHDTRAILDTIEDTGVKVAWSEAPDTTLGTTIFTVIAIDGDQTHAVSGEDESKVVAELVQKLGFEDLR